MVARLQYLRFCLFEMYVNVFFVIRRLYSAENLTLVREQRFIGMMMMMMIIIIIIIIIVWARPVGETKEILSMGTLQQWRFLRKVATQYRC